MASLLPVPYLEADYAHRELEARFVTSRLGRLDPSDHNRCRLFVGNLSMSPHSVVLLAEMKKDGVLRNEQLTQAENPNWKEIIEPQFIKNAWIARHPNTVAECCSGMLL